MAVMVYTHIWEALCSNLGWGIDFLMEVLHGFFSVPPGKF
jgi:hypothetical protein